MLTAPLHQRELAPLVGDGVVDGLVPVDDEQHALRGVKAALFEVVQELVANCFVLGGAMGDRDSGNLLPLSSMPSAPTSSSSPKPKPSM